MIVLVLRKGKPRWHTGGVFIKEDFQDHLPDKVLKFGGCKQTDEFTVFGSNGFQGSILLKCLSKVLIYLVRIVFTAVDKTKFNEEINDEEKYNDISTLWRFMAFHITLSLQKKFQGAIKGRRDRKVNPKGSCLLVFDNEHREESKFTELIINSPDWADSYYQKKEKQIKLNQIIDVPNFVDSKQVGLIQLADFICFFLRKHIELRMGLVELAYRDEIEKVASWTELLLNQSIPNNNIFMSRGRCDCAEMFYKYAPDIIK